MYEQITIVFWCAKRVNSARSSDNAASRGVARITQQTHSVLLDLPDDLLSCEPNGFAAHEDHPFGEGEDSHPCLSNQSNRD